MPLYKPSNVSSSANPSASLSSFEGSSSTKSATFFIFARTHSGKRSNPSAVSFSNSPLFMRTILSNSAQKSLLSPYLTERLSMGIKGLVAEYVQSDISLPDEFSKAFSHLLHFRLDDELAVWRVRILFEILLVVLFSREEFPERNKLCDDPRAIFQRCVHFFYHLLRRLFVLIRFVKNNGAILFSSVRSLPIRRSRVMRAEKDGQQVLV